MTITGRKLLRAFYHISVGIMVIGSIVLVLDNEMDIYALWAVVAFLAGSYLIESK